MKIPSKNQFDKAYARWEIDHNTKDFYIIYYYLFSVPYKLKDHTTMPNPEPKEKEQDYVNRFMKSKEARKDFPDSGQRAAVAYSKFKQAHKEKK